MPDRIDRIGRAHEWATRHFILKDSESKKEMEHYLNLIDNELDKKRVLISSEKAAEYIISRKNKKIISTKVVGEENKTPGTNDSDLKIKFDDKSEEEYSLKIQKKAGDVNVRNPSMNSLCKIFTGKNFEEFLTEQEKKEYEENGLLYSEDKIKSKQIGYWGAQKLSEILNEELKKDPINFLKTMLQEIRYKSNMLITIVDDSPKFIKHITKFLDIYEKAIKDPKNIKIHSSGISIYVSIGKDHLFHIDIYMMSDSSGKGKKLRAAIRPYFE